MSDASWSDDVNRCPHDPGMMRCSFDGSWQGSGGSGRTVVSRKRGIGNCAIFKYSYDGTVFMYEEVVIHDFSNLDPELAKTVYVTGRR